MGFVDTNAHLLFAAEKLRKNPLFATEQLVCDIYCLKPGQEQAPHAHAGQTKFYYVVNGEGLFTLGDESRRLGPGGLAWAAGGEVHGVRNESDHHLVLLVSIAPDPNL